jgi:hypothetical protein
MVECFWREGDECPGAMDQGIGFASGMLAAASPPIVCAGAEGSSYQHVEQPGSEQVVLLRGVSP